MHSGTLITLTVFARTVEFKSITVIGIKLLTSCLLEFFGS